MCSFHDFGSNLFFVRICPLILFTQRILGPQLSFIAQRQAIAFTVYASNEAEDLGINFALELMEMAYEQSRAQQGSNGSAYDSGSYFGHLGSVILQFGRRCQKRDSLAG